MIYFGQDVCGDLDRAPKLECSSWKKWWWLASGVTPVSDGWSRDRKARVHAHGENTVVVEYELRAADCDPMPDCALEVRPLIAFRLIPRRTAAPFGPPTTPFASSRAVHIDWREPRDWPS
jgi:hypothetical protein